MLGTDGESIDDSHLQCLYTAPNWYQSHILDSNSSYLAYGARNMVQVLDHSLVPLRMLSGHPKRVTTVCFSGDTTLVSGCDGGMVISWDVKTGQMLTRLLQTPIPVCVVVCKSGRVFSGDEKGIVCVWEELSETAVVRCQPFSEKIYTISCSDHDSGVLLAIGYKLGTIAIMSINDGELTLLHTLKGHDMDIFKVSWAAKSSQDIYASVLSGCNCEDIIVSTSRDKSLKIWDGKNNRLIRSLQHPPKVSTHRDSSLNREQPWTSLVWTEIGIIASAFSGDIALLEDSETDDGICELKWKSFDSPSAHNRKVFALCSLGEGLIVSTSMDRETVVWNTVSPEVVQIAHGLGGFAYGLDISPLSPNRVAVATGDNMVRIWEPYQNKVIQIWQSVRTKVMVVAWHPYREGILSFGTEEGRVGIYDTNSGSMNTSSTYHEKSVYSMSWGYVPTKFKDDPLKTGLYTCGGEGTIFCHKPKELGKPAVNVNSYIAAENKYKNQPPGRSAVDWEFESKILAVGCTNGVIEVFKAPNLQLIVVYQYHSRIINKLRWGRNEGDCILISPDVVTDSNQQFLLASCSDDNAVCVQDMTSVISQHSSSTIPQISSPGPQPDSPEDNDSQNPTLSISEVEPPPPPPSLTPVLKSHRTLTGHTARITDIDWNPHNHNLIVSTSYDGTAQVWNVLDGVGVSNYRGHAGRVFSVRWSHTKMDAIFSGSDEFTVRQWRLSDNEENVPPKTNLLAPASRTNASRRKKKNAKKNLVISENKVEKASASDVAPSWRVPDEVKESLENGAHEVDVESPIVPQPVTVLTVGDGKRKRGTKGKSLLPLASRRDHVSKQEQAEQIIQIAQDIYSESPVLSDKLSAVDVGLYSRDLRIFDMISEEQSHHEKESHYHQSNLLGIWRSDITGTINRAIETKTVTESLLSVAVMCGLDKYEEAVRCYIAQLTSSRDFVTAASYHLILGQTREAVKMLTDEECYREALAVAKLRLSPNDEMIKSIYQKWAKRQEEEMQFDSAIKCYLACGDPSRALLVMLRRKDSASLKTTLEVAKITAQLDMVPVIQEALDEALRTEGENEAGLDGVSAQL